MKMVPWFREGMGVLKRKWKNSEFSDHKTSSTPVSSFKEAAAAFKQAQEAEKITPSSTISPISSIFSKPPTTSLPNFPSFTTSTPIQQAEDKTKTAPPPISGFRFGSPPQPSTATTNEALASKPTIPLFTFGQPAKSTTEEKDKAEIKIPTFSFGNQGFPSSIQPTTSQKEIATEGNSLAWQVVWVEKLHFFVDIMKIHEK
jgi:hypothetical protein